SGPRCQDTILGGVDAQTSHIKYALTKNPTIYTSLIQQFWETASASTSENGEMEITATIDGRVKTITEASIRRHLKLEDSDGIPTLPNAKIFKQLALMGVQSLGSDKGSLTLNELTVLCTKLSKKVEDLQNDLNQTKLTYGAAYTKLILRVKKLEHKIQEDAETRGRTSADTEILLELEELSKLVEDPGSGEKGEKEISTVEILVSTASAIPEVSTAIPERQVYIRRSVEKRKDKGKAIMKDDESLQEEIDIARKEQEKYDLAQALELQKELDKRKEGVAETTQAHDIDWSDPAVIRYHALQNRSFSVAKVRKNMCMYLKNQGGYKQSHFKGMSYDDVRLIFERVWDQNHAFVLKDSEIEMEVMKRPGFDLQQKQPAEEEKLKKNDDISKSAGGSRKKTFSRKKAG
ncbi:hypothetical protein Tco_1325414, partial [Tanacetum coccineum]